MRDWSFLRAGSRDFAFIIAGWWEIIIRRDAILKNFSSGIAEFDFFGWQMAHAVLALDRFLGTWASIFIKMLKSSKNSGGTFIVSTKFETKNYFPVFRYQCDVGLVALILIHIRFNLAVIYFYHVEHQLLRCETTLNWSLPANFCGLVPMRYHGALVPGSGTPIQNLTSGWIKKRGYLLRMINVHNQ